MAVVQITFNLEGAVATKLVDAICANHGYQATIGGSPNPETANQFAKRMTYDWWKSQVIAAQQRAASAAEDITGS